MRKTGKVLTLLVLALPLLGTSLVSGSVVAVNAQAEDTGVRVSSEVAEDPVIEAKDEGITITDVTDEESAETETVYEDYVTDRDAQEFITEAHEKALQEANKQLSIAIMPFSISNSVAARAAESLSVGSSISYYGYSTHRYTVLNQEAYCIEPGARSPSSGNYTSINAYTIDAEGHGKIDVAYLRACMYYLYGAPGFDKSIFPSRYYDGDVPSADDYWVMSHLLVSKAFQNSSRAIQEGCTESFYDWYWENLTGDRYNGASENTTWNKIAYTHLFAEVPDGFEIHFLSTGNNTQLIAYWTYEETKTDITVSKNGLMEIT